MNISRISPLGNNIGITTTFLLGRKPEREYPSSVKMNISRIDSKGKEYLSSVRMNISRIDFPGKRENKSAGEKIRGSRLRLSSIRKKYNTYKSRRILPVTV